MLPFAMVSLLDSARRGLDIPAQMYEYEHQEQQQQRVHWRTCVHALNIIRLLLLDSALGHDMVCMCVYVNFLVLVLTNELYIIVTEYRILRMDIFPKLLL